MVCFCKKTMEAIQRVLPQLAAVPAPQDAADGLPTPPLDGGLGQIAEWLARHGLPADPWQPDDAWRDLELPNPPLDQPALATLLAFGQIRTDAQALGIDLLDPGQAMALTRLVATSADRIASAMQAPDAPSPFNPAVWTELANALTAADQVQQAVEKGYLPLPPAGPPLAEWRPFLSRLRDLLPLIALPAQFGFPLSGDLGRELATMLRGMLKIPVPAVPAGVLPYMGSLVAALAAVDRIGKTLGVDPLQTPLPVLRRLVADRVAQTARAVQSATGKTPAELQSALPRIPYCPTLMATPAVVQQAMALNLPPIPWRVPAVADIALLNRALPIVAFTRQVQSALGQAPARLPCGATCDART